MYLSGFFCPKESSTAAKAQNKYKPAYECTTYRSIDHCIIRNSKVSRGGIVISCPLNLQVIKINQTIYYMRNTGELSEPV